MTASEALSWLKQEPDAKGECDRCHRDPVCLWHLPQEMDDEPDARWLFCSHCFAHFIHQWKAANHGA